MKYERENLEAKCIYSEYNVFFLNVKSSYFNSVDL